MVRKCLSVWHPYVLCRGNIMLQAKNLIKCFERNEKSHKKVIFRAVDDISVSVSGGEIVGILGPNGAGKTTLLRMLGNLMKPTEGTVLVRDGEKQLSDELEIKKKIGYLSGNTRLYGRLSTRELLGIIGSVYGMSSQQTEERIKVVSEILEMEEFIDNRMEKLSTGQTQRASIARCLLHNPDIYIFDEPTLGLDILSSNAIIDFMKKERDKGKAVIYSTHYMEEAEYLCDRLIIVGKGRIIEQGSVEELKHKYDADNLRAVFMSLMAKEGDL